MNVIASGIWKKKQDSKNMSLVSSHTHTLYRSTNIRDGNRKTYEVLRLVVLSIFLVRRVFV